MRYAVFYNELLWTQYSFTNSGYINGCMNMLLRPDPLDCAVEKWRYHQLNMGLP
jgi:hypothetical protein